MVTAAWIELFFCMQSRLMFMCHAIWPFCRH